LNELPTPAAFLHALLLVPITLLPIINPIGTAPVFTMTAGDDAQSGRLLARQVTINCWLILVASMFVGTYVLEVFGISIPIVRIGGGLLVAASAWRMLSGDDDDEMTTAVRRTHPGDLTRTEVIKRSFFPLTFPLTAGPGTIATSIAIGAGLPRQPTLYIASAFVTMLGATLTVAAIYLVYRNASVLMAWLGEVGALVMTRLMAFVLLCIGIEIIWTGWAELHGIASR